MLAKLWTLVAIDERRDLHAPGHLTAEIPARMHCTEIAIEAAASKSASPKAAKARVRELDAVGRKHHARELRDHEIAELWTREHPGQPSQNQTVLRIRDHFGLTAHLTGPCWAKQ